VKGRKALISILGLATAMAVVAGYVAWDANRKATAAFERHDRDVTARVAAWRSRARVSHPAIFGEVFAGNGWAALQRALKGFEAIPEADGNEIPEINGELLPEDVKDEAVLEAIFVKHAAAVEELRQALRHAYSDPSYAYEEGLSMEVPAAGGIK